MLSSLAQVIEILGRREGARVLGNCEALTHSSRTAAAGVWDNAVIGAAVSIIESEAKVAVELDFWTHAQAYVGNANEYYFMAGICQLELLKKNGLRPHHRLLEIGCGALVAGRPIMQYLNPDCYVGIEPNAWLVDAARNHFPDMEGIFYEKKPHFLARTDFDASELGRKFDFVVSHSILSHAPHWQLPLFLERLSNVLTPYGTIIASLRLYDEHGTLMGDSMHEDWQYPDATYFSAETIEREAEKFGLTGEHHPEYREFFTKHVPRDIHDWVRFRKKWNFGDIEKRPREALYGHPDRSGLEQEGRR